jgi:hypothetical protein
LAEKITSHQILTHPIPSFPADNFSALIYLSSRLLLENLRRELERIASEKESQILDAEGVSMTNMVEILVEASQADFSEASQRELCRRVGSKFKKDEVYEFLTKSYPPMISDALGKKLQPYVS